MIRTLIRTLAVVLLAVLALSAVAPATTYVVVGPRDSADPFSLARRHRLELRFGHWDSGWESATLPPAWAAEESSVENLVGAVSYTWWAHESLAAHVTLRGLIVEAREFRDAWDPWATYEHAVVLSSGMFGLRLYPVPARRFPLKPYVTAGLGPVIGVEHEKHPGPRGSSWTETLATFGGHVGTGLDFQLGRHVMLGVEAGYNAMADFPEPLAGRRNYSGPEFSAGLSFLFGKGLHRH